MDRLKILVVDDESRMRKLVRDFLVKHDFDVVETVLKYTHPHPVKIPSVHRSHHFLQSA